MMPKTRRLPPAHRTEKPTHDLARRGPESSSSQTTPSGPLTDRTAKRALRDKKNVDPTRDMPSDDNAREAHRKSPEPGTA
jgi:hypothetical protein